MWVTGAPGAEAAEAYLGRGWRVLRLEFLAPTGDWVNTKDPEWAVCDPDVAAARPGWCLVDTEAEIILDQRDGEEIRNPHYGGLAPGARDISKPDRPWRPEHSERGRR